MPPNRLIQILGASVNPRPILKSVYEPMPFQRSSCGRCAGACIALMGITSLMYLSTKSAKVCFFASVALKCRPSLIADSVF